MGKLLDGLGKWRGAVLWKHNAGEGIEGEILATKRVSGKFDSTWFLLECDDGAMKILSVPVGSTLEREISGLSPEIGDRVAVLFEGKSAEGYNGWQVAIEHARKRAANGKEVEAEIVEDEIPF